MASFSSDTVRSTQQFTHIGGLPTPSGAPSMQVSHAFRLTRSDNVKSPLVGGWRPPRPFSINILEYSNWVGRVGYTTRYNSGSIVEGVCNVYCKGQSVPSCPVASANMVNRAEVQCLLRIRDQKADVSTSIIEARKTVQGVAERLTKLVQGYRDFKSRNFSKVFRDLGFKPPKGALKTMVRGKWVLKEIRCVDGRKASHTWMELNMMWLPTLMEVKGLVDFFHQLGEFRVSADYTSYEHVDDLVSTIDYGTRCKTRSVGQYGAKVRLDYSVDSRFLKKAAELGLDNPAAVAWEVLPLSWLSDYVVPIGDWLSALTATTGLIFKGGSCTKFGEVKTKGRTYPEAQAPWYYPGPGLNRADTVGRHKYVTRTVYNTSPIPSLYVNDTFSVWKLANALALFRSHFK